MRGVYKFGSSVGVTQDLSNLGIESVKKKKARNFNICTSTFCHNLQPKGLMNLNIRDFRLVILIPLLKYCYIFRFHYTYVFYSLCYFIYYRFHLRYLKKQNRLKRTFNINNNYIPLIINCFNQNVIYLYCYYNYIFRNVILYIIITISLSLLDISIE